MFIAEMLPVVIQEKEDLLNTLQLKTYILAIVFSDQNAGQVTRLHFL